ncbi:MAG: hypothetical protein CVU38_06665 [Chloroflexi bacterium HGW-Chloroflexi-1]|nr:MAG: hypothetical protein CVU38_06665 [Chloroflexi bacterium HGW-Chloroflexi-1]
MSQLDPNRRFQLALDRARAGWAAAEPARCAALAGCDVTPAGIVVPYFGRPHRVTHPDGAATTAEGKPAHISITIVLLHYLLIADGAAPADRWLSFRELPDGLFYAQAFADHAEGEISQRFGADVTGFRQAATALGGAALDLADASFRFQALPRLAVAVLLWAGDDEFPGQARMLFDAHAGHYLPTEDLAGIGDWLAHKLIAAGAGL